MYGEHVSNSNGSTEEFQWKIYSKIGFSDRAFNFTIANADIGSLSLSLHTLFDKYLDRMLVEFEQSRTVQNHTKFCAF